MESFLYRYRFIDSLDISEVQATVTLSVLATESLHGESRVRLETRHNFDSPNRTCEIDDTSEVGQDLNRLFLGFVSREFGQESFQVERVASDECAPTE
jgi:hypothetical protein